MSFITIWVFGGYIYIFWQNKFLSLVTIGVLSHFDFQIFFSSQLKFLNFIKKKNCHCNLIFWVLSQLEFLNLCFWFCHTFSFVFYHNLSFWVLSQFEYFSFLTIWFYSFVTIWVHEFCHNEGFFNSVTISFFLNLVSHNQKLGFFFLWKKLKGKITLILFFVGKSVIIYNIFFFFFFLLFLILSFLCE